jgi:hypothetical protein
VVDQDVVADNGSFSDDDAHAVVNDETATEFSGGVYLYACDHASPVGPYSGEGLEFDGPEKVSLAMIPECM